MVNVVDLDKMQLIVLKDINYILVQLMKQMVQQKYGIQLKVTLEDSNLMFLELH